MKAQQVNPTSSCTIPVFNQSTHTCFTAFNTEQLSYITQNSTSKVKPTSRLKAGSGCEQHHWPKL